MKDKYSNSMELRYVKQQLILFGKLEMHGKA